MRWQSGIARKAPTESRLPSMGRYQAAEPGADDEALKDDRYSRIVQGVVE